MAQRLDKQTRTQTRTQKRTSHKGEPALRSVRAEICRFLPGIALFLLAVLTFVPSMTNGFIWDDPAYVIDNQTLKSADGLWRIWTEPQSVPQYYPMVHTTFWLEARLWGTDRAPGYHIDNILLHALAVVLLWRALRAIDLPWPWLAAAIFAVHPVMVESVTWVTERKNVLSIVFYLLAFHAYCQSGRMNQSMASADTGSKQRQKRWYLFSLLLFLLALFSKTVTCSLPAAILLLIYLKHARITRDDVKPLLPMFGIGLVLALVTSHLEATHVGASGPDFQWTPIDRCLIAGHAICFYATKLIWPHPLMFMYPHWNLNSDRAFQFVYPTCAVAVVLLLWIFRRRLGRGPLVAVLFFIGTLTPALGFVNVYPMRYSFVADHFQYLASIGLITLFTAILSKMNSKPAGMFAISPWVLAPLIVLTWHQQRFYKDAHTLWQHTIDQNETCWMAHINLAGVLQREHKTAEAIVQSERALQLAPYEADTNYDVGVARAQQAQWTEAANYFRLAVQYDPTCAPAWSYLARVLWEHFDTPEAQSQAYEAARKALSVRPGTDLADAHYVLARVAEFSGDLPAAVAEYNKTLTLNGKDFHAHYNLGVCLLQLHQPGNAAGEFLKVLEHDPKDAAALSNMGQACLDVGNLRSAIAYFQSALSLDPKLAPAREGLRRASGHN